MGQNSKNKLISKMRVLNESTTKWLAHLLFLQIFSLPRLDTILEQIGRCEYYSSLDLSQEFLQIKVCVADWELYLTNVTNILICHLVYANDIYSRPKKFDDHLKVLRRVFECLRQSNLKLSPRKCHLLENQ